MHHLTAQSTIELHLVRKAGYILDRIGAALTRPTGFEEPARRVYRDVADLRENLALPTYM